MSIKKFILSNGITVISDKRDIKTSSFIFHVKTGAANEVKQFGISHLVEHLMFKSTYKRSSQEINQQIKFTGSRFNAYTGYECTCYHFESLPQHFKTVLDIYADFLQNKNISVEEFNKEKDVVLQEIAMYKDDEPSVNLDNTFKRVFGLQSVGGLTKTVKKITLEEVLDYIKKTYIPKNITISVCSKFSHRKIKQMMENYFNNFKDSIPPKYYDMKPEIKVEQSFKKALGTSKKVKKDSNQTKICMVVPLSKEDSLKLNMTRNILIQIFCKGLSSVVYNELREKEGLFYRFSGDFYSQIAGYKQPHLLLETSTEPKNIRKLIKELKQIIATFSSYITRQDVQKALNVIEMQNVKDGSYNIADDNLHNFLDYNVIYNDKDYERILKSIKFEDIVAEAKKWSYNKSIIQMLG